MKQGIPCNDYHELGPARQNKITFTFVGGEDVPHSCTVRLGDRDPLTGERITEVIFREYHKQRNREIYYNKKCACEPLRGQAKKDRKALRQRLAAEFEEKYGYVPDRYTLNQLVADVWPKLYRIYIDAPVDEEDVSFVDCLADYRDWNAEEQLLRVEEKSNTERLQEFASTLSGRLKEVYELMLLQAAGVCVHGRSIKLAERWGVSKSQISKDRDKLERMIRAWMMEEN